MIRSFPVFFLYSLKAFSKISWKGGGDEEELWRVDDVVPIARRLLNGGQDETKTRGSPARPRIRERRFVGTAPRTGDNAMAQRFNIQCSTPFGDIHRTHRVQATPTILSAVSP